MEENIPTPLGKFLEKKYGKNLTDEELVTHKNKLVQFVSLLIEIDKKNKQKERDKTDGRHN